MIYDSKGINFNTVKHQHRIVHETHLELFGPLEV